MNIRKQASASTVTAALCIGIGVVAVHAVQFTDWSPSVNAETVVGTDNFNTTALDGCPAPSPNGLEFYMASNRMTDSQGRLGMGGIDIWISKRNSVDAPWGEPENLGAPVNSSADDFCPTPLRDGKGLLFVSRRTLLDQSQCGRADIYYARRQHDQWSEPVHLDCTVNSAGEEFSPFLVEYDDGASELYFSSTRAGGVSSEQPTSPTGDADLYVSEVTREGNVAPPVLVPSVNTAANDFRPSLRRDGLELFFDSNRPGSVPNAMGNPSLDIWSARRDSRFDAWTVPEPLGPNVNTPADETRPFLTWDRLTLFFGRSPGTEGNSDIYLTSRERITGK
jgi:WD40-like Beta Propeller Repeat